MLEYCKLILSKVSFSKDLFEKELKKAIKGLVADEIQELKKWCYSNFSHMYYAIIQKYFSPPVSYGY